MLLVAIEQKHVRAAQFGTADIRRSDATTSYLIFEAKLGHTNSTSFSNIASIVDNTRMSRF